MVKKPSRKPPHPVPLPVGARANGLTSAVPHALGMTTVLVVPHASYEVVREGWEMEGRQASHVDHVTDDLAGFLEGVVVRSVPP